MIFVNQLPRQQIYQRRMKRVEFQLRNFRIISMSRKKSMTRYQSENARSNSLQPRSIFISSKFAKIIPKLRETRLSPQARQEMDNHKKSLFEERIHDQPKLRRQERSSCTDLWFKSEKVRASSAGKLKFLYNNVASEGEEKTTQRQPLQKCEDQMRIIKKTLNFEQQVAKESEKGQLANQEVRHADKSLKNINKERPFKGVCHCRVNKNIFVSVKKKRDKDVQLENFWSKVNESLIMEPPTQEEPSIQLTEFVRVFPTATQSS